MRRDSHPGIDFERVIIEKVNLEVNPDYQKVNEGIPVDVSFTVNRQLIESQRLLKLSLEISVFKEAKSPPLNVSVVATGYFRVKKEEDFKALEEFSHIQAPALVFPFVREIIAELTMRTGYPPLLVPPTNITVLVGKAPKKAKIKSK